MHLCGDIFLGSVVSSCLTKLYIRASNLPDEISVLTVKDIPVKFILMMCTFVEMVEGSVSSQ